MKNISHLLIGSSGIGGIQLLEHLTTAPNGIELFFKLFIQIVVGGVTVFVMLRNNRKKNK